MPDPAAGASQAGGIPRAKRIRAFSVHLLTASGVVFAFLAAAEVCSPSPDPRIVFAFLAIQVLIDAADGPLARLWQVKVAVPEIDGRKISVFPKDAPELDDFDRLDMKR